jgi:hypothetical protein
MPQLQNANSQFYKTLPVKDYVEAKDRLWLNLENSDGCLASNCLVILRTPLTS